MVHISITEEGEYSTAKLSSQNEKYTVALFCFMTICNIVWYRRSCVNVESIYLHYK